MRWSYSGDKYMLVGDNTIDLYNSGDNKLLAAMKQRSRINGAVFTNIGKDSESDGHWCITCINDNNTINMFDLKGLLVS